MNHHAQLDSGWDINWLVQASDRTSTRANSEKGISPVIFMDRDNPGNYSYDASDFERAAEFRVIRRLVDYGQLRNYTGEQDNFTQSLSFGRSIGQYEFDFTWSYGKSELFPSRPQPNTRR